MKKPPQRRPTKRTSTIVPDRGDVVWLDFNPQTGHEQAGRRPALVLSPATYNAKVGLAVVCPITSHVKGYPCEVALPATGSVTGVVLSDQIKSLDWRARKVQCVGQVPERIVRQVIETVMTVLESDEDEDVDGNEEGGDEDED